MIFIRYLLLFVPYFVATFMLGNPMTSYYISWFGSLLIMIYSIGGYLKPLPNDLPIRRQLFRPIFLGQILFMGYTALTSIFYFLDIQGYFYFEKISPYADYYTIGLVAKCQSYIVLAHAAYVLGLYLKTDYDNNRNFKYRITLNQNTMLYVSIITFIGNIVVSFTPFRQMSIYLLILSALSNTQFLFISINSKRNVFLAVVLFLLLFIAALFTGMKEASLLVLFFLFMNLYAKYKYKAVIFTAPIIIGYMYFLPAINKEFRQLSWYGGKNNIQAYSEILDEKYIDGLDFKSENWEFLTIRSSEISMFVKYVEYVPEKRDFYKYEIINSSLLTLIPRFVWPEKPIADLAPDKRSIESGAFARGENEFTSAKPQYVADAYLTYGKTSILIFFFILGFLSTQFSIMAEKRFGGYFFGTILIYHSCFYILNRGGCLENMFNSVFYGFLMMLLLHRVMIQTKIIEVQY